MKYSFKQPYDNSDDERDTPVLIVSHVFKREISVGQIHIQPVFIRGTDESGRREYGFYGDYTSTGECILNGFEISCQWNTMPSNDWDTCKPYAWRVGYTSSEFTVEDMGRNQMRISFLKKIEKGIEKHREKFGNIDSFDEFVMVVANIISVKTFIKKNGEYSFLFDYVSSPREYIANLWRK